MGVTKAGRGDKVVFSAFSFAFYFTCTKAEVLLHLPFILDIYSFHRPNSPWAVSILVPISQMASGPGL